MANDIEGVDTGLIREAEEVANTVRRLRRLMLRSFEPDIARSGLTAPQINTMRELAREDGLSLKELSRRMELSHRTRRIGVTAAYPFLGRSKNTYGMRWHFSGGIRS